MAIPLAPGEKAHMYALGGVMRGGVGRAGYIDGRVYLAIDGQHVAWGRDGDDGTLLDTLTITDQLDETPNRCTFRVNGFVPETGAEVVLTLGSKNRKERLFAGYGLTVEQVYAGVPKNVQADVACVDYTWLLGFMKVTAQYTNQSAGAIVADLVQTYAAANGFTTTNTIAAGLPVLDEITFTDEDLTTAITRVARRTGCYWYVDYHKGVHLFVTETGNGAPRALTPTHPTFTAFSRQADRTQVLTRVYVEGRGSRLLASVNAGDDRIPLESVDMFQPAGDVFAKVAFQGSQGGAQHLNYSAIDAGGIGTVIGPGVTPSTALSLSPALGAGLSPGVRQYAYTWQTAAGETRPSPLAAVDVTGQTTAAPLQAPLWIQDPPSNVPGSSYGSNYNIGATFRFAYAWSTSATLGNETQLSALSPGSAPIVAISNGDSLNPAMSAVIRIGVPPSPDVNVKSAIVYASMNGGPYDRALLTLTNPVYTAEVSTNGANEPVPGSWPHPGAASASRVQVSGIATGPGTVTGRKLYRTPAGLATLQLLTTIADNATTTYLDAAADATLGAAPPVTDTSSLPQPAGQVPPGSASIVVASTAPFRSDGGWAILGNGEQILRYTGVGTGALTGIPTTGRGALTATVVYNTTITAAPLLLGMPASGFRSIRQPLTAGDEIYLVVLTQNVSLQETLARALNVAFGVREDWIQDRRLSIAEARARGYATLALRPLDEIAVSYRCRDLLTASGKTISVNLPAPTNVVGEYKIQQVTIANFRPRAGQYPTYTVLASSARFSFEDLLNRFRVKE
jgi:hypothetical protein